jgi:FkbM family methyltransferase
MARLRGRSRSASEFDVGRLPRLLGKPDPVILEIGCNDGTDTRQFLRLFDAVKIYVFEPEPRAVASFRRNVQDDRVTLFEMAISDVDGTIDFHPSGGSPSPEWNAAKPDGWDFSGSIKRPKTHLTLHPWCEFSDAVAVRSMTLDTWCAQHRVGDIDFIWADVQGAEEEVIRGGQRALQRTRYFYTEYSNEELYQGQINLTDIERLLPDFKIVGRFANDVLFENARLR